ncbi:MAG TPA: very short patch repair endonuclease [Bryobacteraceae bacterium]
MTSNRTDASRSAIMRAVKSQDTAPEMLVRRLVHRLGYRYRLHRKDLPGKPDLVFPGRRKIVFVHGCFWHGHHCRRGARIPKTNRDYWVRKIERNKQRDKTHSASLIATGWRVLILWECDIVHATKLSKKLIGFLGRLNIDSKAAVR